MAKKKRELANWLESFTEWVAPRSEAPRSMIKWAGLFGLAAVSKRKVTFPKRYMGGYEIFPNLYIVFVAEPGIARKSTTVGYTEELLWEIKKLMTGETIDLAGDITSHSKILDALSNSHDSAVAIVSSEFSSLIQTTPESTYELLTDIFDNKRKVTWTTWTHGDIEISDPVVNLFAATTPAWVSRQPPEYFLGGGFGSRVLFVFEKEKAKSEIYYDHLDWKKLNKLGSKLVHDLNLIANLKGEFSHDSKDTKEYIRSWYLKHDSKEPAEIRLRGFHSRKHVHAHKIAMLVSMAQRNDLKITKKDWDMAIDMLDNLESKYPRSITSMGANPMSAQQNAILDYIDMKEKVTKKELAGRFYNEITLDQLNATLTYLVVADKIKTSGPVHNPTFQADRD